MRSLADVLESDRLPALDGLRAVAAFTVLIYHAGYPVPGDLGVTAFFALSGFLITWLLLREHDTTGTISLSSFYARRSLRIFPAYFAFILASIAIDRFVGNPWTPGQVATALTYTSNYYQAFNEHSGPASHSWSLAVEEQFYLVWPALFLVLIRGGERRLRNGIIAIIAAVLVWRSGIYLGGLVPKHYAYNAFDARIDSILMGALLAVLCRSPVALRRLDRLTPHVLVPLAVVAVLYVARTGGTAAWHYSIGLTVYAALCTILIAQLLRTSGTRLWRWLDHPVTRWLGAISYPLYLWHKSALAAAQDLPGPRVLHLVVGALVAVAVAAGSYYVIERPFLALKARYSNRGSSPSLVPAE